ncbi:MAG TPA: protein phosphatase 2C domain-containing protein, partial [Polyangiaceae bacterium LLY-WYZ-15_(1-7)]|nr:protein phosphatase 2C domain-containing protein [Polyangiaceae bacterium LLY-WYZ-15_(1-7)]
MSNEGRTETEAPDEEEAPPEKSAEAGEGRDPSEEKEDVTATVPDMPAAKVAAEMRKRAEEEDEAADGDGDADDGEEEEEQEELPPEDLPPEDTGPEGPITFRYFGLTDVGLVREHNEDNFTVVDLATEEAWWGGEGEDANSPKEILEGELGPQGLVFAVCDGMGGAAAGEVASKMAVETIREVMLAGDPPQERDGFAHRLVYAIEEAGARIFSAAKMDRSRRGMGTTATVAGLVDRVLFIGQVGDSRCYVLRDGELSLVTKDQSLVNQLIEAGQLTEEEAEAFEHSNIILQALGTTEEVAVDLTFLELRQGDRLMLCSDGLSGLVHGEMIQEMMAEGDDLQAIAMKLVEMANAGGGHDNITCVVAEVGGEGLAAAEGAPAAIYQQYPLPPAD